ncbi:hypothetical protein ADL12_44880 [Streptomyces regalis]|uniref:Uncharacterized protein n=1 Tax=Streptomyces regalis TaxID=68262 RepID=A0A124G719_9ACTN|nr:hypothetical protein ADL12_44880 [Streptomyces regalis]
MQRQEAVWQARRDAYASFLGQIEVMKRAIAHMQATAGMYEEGLGRSGADLTAAKEAMARTFEVLWFRESALRLSVDTDEADRAEALMVLARRAMEHAEDFADAAWSAQRGPYEPGRRLDAAMRELHGGVLEWTRTARRNLEGGAQATD